MVQTLKQSYKVIAHVATRTIRPVLTNYLLCCDVSHKLGGTKRKRAKRGPGAAGVSWLAPPDEKLIKACFIWRTLVGVWTRPAAPSCFLQPAGGAAMTVFILPPNELADLVSVRSAPLSARCDVTS